MPRSFIRILSDLHYGDHASRLRRLDQLRPLLVDVDHVVLNGDSLDTRPGPFPAHTAACREAILDFFRREVPATTYLTGNHDADFSPLHHLDFAKGAAFAIHGDVFFDDIVPWSQDAPLVRRRIAEEMRAVPVSQQHDLAVRMAVFRRVAASVPQRHQSERNRLKYAWHYVADTVWPPTRIVRILQAWQSAAPRAVAFAQRHRPAARFVVSGHTHRPGIWTSPHGIAAINTGSFCAPLGGTCVDLLPGELIVRRIESRGGEFHPGRPIAAFPLAER